MKRLLVAATLPILLLMIAPRASHACGAAYPGGPVMCDFPRVVASPRPIARLSASYAFTSTTLLFGDGRRADLTRHAVFGALQFPISQSGALSLQLGAGGIAGGELTRGTSHGTARDTIGPGFAGFVGIAGRVIDGRGALPFVQLTATFSATHAITHTQPTTPTPTQPETRSEAPRFNAFDLRGGAIVGKTFGDVFTPYVTARVFGGPIYWRFAGADVTGTDLYKYQVGGGLSLALLERRLDFFVEGIGLGERGVATGVGTTFF